MSSIYLFVYGHMRPHFDDAPKTIKTYMRDTVHGDMYNLGNEPAAVNLGNSTNYIIGDILEIDPAELPRLDKIEFPEYRRVQVETFLGYKAWAYEYKGNIPDDAKPIHQWETEKYHSKD